ncbi:MAG: redoxin domain-containing protein [Pirellulales bacterium]|nr:redoxin domain-containing protein [Pirellulales bacterium]
MTISKSQSLLMLNAVVLTAILGILIAVFWRGNQSQETTYPTISDFALLDQEGKFHKLSRYANDRGVVLYVYGVGCPIARNHLPALKRLREKYMKQGIEFLLLDCNPQDDRETLQQDAQERNIDIPILRDEGQLVMEMMGIKRTCETFLIDPKKRRVIFHGPVDDRLGYESQKKDATHHYLQDAIDSYLSGDAVKNPDAEIRGCLISKISDAAQNPTTPDYTKDVAPILEKRCFNCHSTGGTAPWALESYEDVLGWRAMIREVILTKRMPPRQPDMHYLPFSETHGIFPEEASTLVRWLDAGAPRGEGKDPLATAKITSDRRIDVENAQIKIDLPPQKIPPTGEVAYRTNALKLQLQKDAWVRAGKIQPTEPEVLHHAFCRTSPVEGDNLNNIGFSKRGISNKWRSSNVAAYVPGMTSFEFPTDTGMKIPRECVLVFLYHYTTIGKSVTDRPKLGVFLHDKPPLFELEMETIERRNFTIPPGESEYQVEDDYTTDEDILIFGIAPHMHYRGSSFCCKIIPPEGKEKTIFSMPNYRMTWQGIYWFKEPLAISKGTNIICTGIFDNSSTNELNPDSSETVVYGQQSWREMFEGWLLYSKRTEKNSEQFDKLFRESLLKQNDLGSGQIPTGTHEE